MKTIQISFLAIVLFAFVGCSQESSSPSSSSPPSAPSSGSSTGGLSSSRFPDEQKINTYTLGDWLHDIDEAKRVYADYGRWASGIENDPLNLELDSAAEKLVEGKITEKEYDKIEKQIEEKIEKKYGRLEMKEKIHRNDGLDGALQISKPWSGGAVKKAYECWPIDPKSIIKTRIFDTANTDHDCLDALGYKRSR